MEEKFVSKAYLILENGKVFEGTSFGKVKKTVGEVVFNTGMVGYLETLTDKNNFGQIVVQTFPMIGNYGVISEDFQSEKVTVNGYIVREICDKPSNFRCEGTLEDYLIKEDIAGICGLDTRALTRILREEGTMNGMITDCGDVTDEILREIDKHGWNVYIPNKWRASISQNSTFGNVKIFGESNHDMDAPHVIIKAASNFGEVNIFFD